jgi:hypothetical protein
MYTSSEKVLRIEFDSMFHDTYDELEDIVAAEFPNSCKSELILEIEDGKLVISEKEE